MVVANGYIYDTYTRLGLDEGSGAEVGKSTQGGGSAFTSL